MERLSGDFNRGYTAALMDVSSLIPVVVAELKRVRRVGNLKYWEAAMALIVEHRAEMRDKRAGFVRWNFERKELEWYAPEEMRTDGDAGDRGGAQESAER